MMRRALMAALILLVATAAGAVPLDQYIGSLERVHALLRNQQIEQARAEARALAGVVVETPSEKFAADSALLNAIAKSPRADVQLQSRLAATILELQRIAPVVAARPDPKLLKSIEQEEAIAELEEGGDALPPIDADPSFLQQIANATAKVFEWIGDLLTKVWEWLLGFLPDLKTKDGEATGGLNWMVVAVVGVIVVVLAILAFEVARRSRRAEPVPIETSEPVASRKDEDPLSRGANEWEKYAIQLAAAGRIRESIRAWYHAVLVTCYAAGILHFRKGRTNWEYISALGPDIPWRSELIQLTRRFEVEWYGQTESSEEALDECSGRARRILDALRRGRTAA